MKKLILAAALAAMAYFGLGQTDALRQLGMAPGSQSHAEAGASSQALQRAFSEQRSGVQVTGEGVVSHILEDDNKGSRHQRFILALASGQTLLIAHNIDLAPRIASIRTGDRVMFHGVYEWNAKGGVVHWTHHDPAGRHEPGWLKHAGQTYQ